MISTFLAFIGSFVKLEPSNFVHFEILSGCLTSLPFFLAYSNMAGFYDSFNDSLINFIRDLVKHMKTWKESFDFF